MFNPNSVNPEPVNSGPVKPNQSRSNQANTHQVRKPWLTLLFAIGLLVTGGAITYAAMQIVLPETLTGDVAAQLTAQADALPLPPKMPVPTLDEVQLAATIMTNAAERPEAAQHIQLVYSLRNQQQLTKLAQLQAEQAQAQADIVRSQSEQQKLLSEPEDSQASASHAGSHQPGARQTAAQETEPKPLETLLLSAIVATPQGDHKATISYDGRRYTVRQGNTIAGDILVEQLSHDAITLSRAGKRLRLYLN